MTWRNSQLDNRLCEQDQKILDLFQDRTVKYIGHDSEFSAKLRIDFNAEDLILIINSPVWCSDIRSLCQKHLTDPIKRFYIGINRYLILGNDTQDKFSITVNPSQDAIQMIKHYTNLCGYQITKTGLIDRDFGKYFNFVQPVTWIYGTTPDTN